MYQQWVETINLNWGRARLERRFLLKFLLNFLACFCLYLLITHFLYINRLRPGTALDDPILKELHPVNFSTWIFVMMYSSVFIFLAYIVQYPLVFYQGLRAFTAVFAVRAVFILVTPLSPPADIIMLRDPFIDAVIGFKGEVMNDLFFSGHVADLYIFAFLCRKGWVKNWMITGAVLLSIMIVWQKVHYTADVLAAPFFSYVCYSVFVKNRVTEFSE